MARITLPDATTMTALYRTKREAILDTAYQDNATLAISETFDRDEIDELLAQDDCEGLRIYYGMDTSYRVHAILCGVNHSDEDILVTPSLAARSQSVALEGEEDVLFEEAIRCPSSCPPESPLNS